MGAFQNFPDTNVNIGFYQSELPGWKPHLAKKRDIDNNEGNKKQAFRNGT